MSSALSLIGGVINNYKTSIIGQGSKKFRHRDCQSNVGFIAWKAMVPIEFLFPVLRSIAVPRAEQRPMVQRARVFACGRCRSEEL